MNTSTKAEQNALTLPERAAVALGSSKTEAELRDLVLQSLDIVAVNNMAGRDQAHRIGMNLKAARVAIEKTGKTAREDAVAFGKAVIAEEKRLVGIIEQEEDRVFALRDSWDAKVEAERQAKIQAEADRMAKIADHIEGLRERETDVIRICKTAAHTQAEIDALEKVEVTEAIYQERFAEAVALKATVLESMRTILAGRVAAEAAEAQRIADAAAEAARIVAERAELEALRAAAAEHARLAKIESDRVAAEQAAEAKRLADLAAAQFAEARQQQEVAAAAARAEQAERDRISAQVKAQLEQQAAQLAADRKALDDERAADARAKVQAAAALEAAKNPQPVEPAPVEQQSLSAPPALAWPAPGAPTAPPSLRLGQIGERLGFSLSADFLRTLGFEAAARERAAYLYHEADFDNICRALIRHVVTVQNQKLQAA
jgi:hypothetical protein